MKKIIKSSIRIVDSFGYSKSGKIFYRNLHSVKNGKDVDCYVKIKCKLVDGTKIKKEFKTSFDSYMKLHYLSIENLTSKISHDTY